MIGVFYTGLLGDLQHSVAEIGWANLFITNDRARVMDFTDWYLQDPSCFLYKKSDPYTGIHSLIFPLETETWFAILASLLAVNVFFVFHSIFWGQQEVALDTLIIYEAAVTFTNSQNLTHYLPNEGLR